MARKIKFCAKCDGFNVVSLKASLFKYNSCLFSQLTGNFQVTINLIFYNKISAHKTHKLTGPRLTIKNDRWLCFS